jgi:hypothetical protein
MKPNRAAGAAALALVALVHCAPAAAEVTRTTESGFVSRHEAVVEASPKQVWLALISPAGWWRSEHTWSGDAKNLTLMPQAGGCFCETIPEVDEPGRFTLEGSVEHMRVVQAYPESALRMIGALGPLQSEAVNGVLTIAISKVEQGTRIVWEYNVGGSMRYEVPVIAKAVDGVMGAQLAALAKPLKPVTGVQAAGPGERGPAAPPTSSVPQGGAARAAEPKTAGAAPSPPGKAAAAAPAPAPAPKPPATPRSTSVEEAFGSLDEKPPR